MDVREATGDHQFDAIVFDEYSNDKRWISGSEHWSRTLNENGPAETESSIADWIHFVITYDTVNNLVSLYRNGVQYGVSYAPTGGFFTRDASNGDVFKVLFCIRGARDGGQPDRFEGEIDFGAVYL